MKIIIDAGHGGYDNGAKYKGRNEKDDNLKLALAVGERLKEEGYQVVYTRTADIYQTPQEKAMIANEQSGDLFLSFHRNASVIPGEYQGVESLVYSDDGKAFSLAGSISDNLSKLGFRNNGVSIRKDIVVLRETKMPAVLVEAGFIDNEKDNATFDQKFSLMVDLIVNAIKGQEQVKPKASREYGVQIGLFRKRSNAQYLANQVEGEGYRVLLVPQNDLYAVVVGRERTVDDAKLLARELQNEGYDTLVVYLD